MEFLLVNATTWGCQLPTKWHIHSTSMNQGPPSMIDVTQKKIRANGTTLESKFRHSLLKPSMLTTQLEQQFADSSILCLE